MLLVRSTEQKLLLLLLLLFYCYCSVAIWCMNEAIQIETVHIVRSCFPFILIVKVGIIVARWHCHCGAAIRPPPNHQKQIILCFNSLLKYLSRICLCVCVWLRYNYTIKRSMYAWWPQWKWRMPPMMEWMRLLFEMNSPYKENCSHFIIARNCKWDEESRACICV